MKTSKIQSPDGFLDNTRYFTMPIELWFCDTLTLVERCFVAQVFNMSKNRPCTMGRDKFAYLFQISIGRVSNIIFALRKKNVIQGDIGNLSLTPEFIKTVMSPSPTVHEIREPDLTDSVKSLNEKREVELTDSVKSEQPSIYKERKKKAIEADASSFEAFKLKWCGHFKEQLGRNAAISRPKDCEAHFVSLTRGGVSVEDILSTAKQAWSLRSDAKFFWCKSSIDLETFLRQFAKIQDEVMSAKRVSRPGNGNF